MASASPTLQEILQAAETGNLSATVLGQLADVYHDLRTRRLAADKVAAGLKADETAAEQLLINEMQLQKITAVGGSTLRVSLNLNEPDYVPHVKDWDKFYEYIKQNNAFELLERRPGKAACRERWDDGKQVPGVEKFPVFKLSRNEVKK